MFGAEDGARRPEDLGRGIANVRPGTLVGWGYYDRNGTNGTEVVPVSVPPGLTNVVAVAAGGHHALALRADGTVVAWGQSGHGQTAVPEGLTGVVAVAAGSTHSLALQQDGTVVAWGSWLLVSNRTVRATLPQGLIQAISIAAGTYHGLAARSDGTVVSWGWVHGGRGPFPAEVPAGLSDVVGVAAGGYQSLALRRDGSVAAWGNARGWIAPPAGLGPVVELAAGVHHGLALAADGRVVAWGVDDSGQIRVPRQARGAVAIAAGSECSLALKPDGTVVAWGDYDNGTGLIPVVVPRDLGRAVAIAAGGWQCYAIVSPETAFPLVRPGLTVPASETGGDEPWSRPWRPSGDEQVLAGDPARGGGYAATVWRGEQGLPQNTVAALHQSRDGYVWVGTRYGLARFDGVRLTAYVDELAEVDDDATDVRGLAEDGEGRLWLHSRRTLTVRARGRFRKVPLTGPVAEGAIQAIVADRSGAIWVLKPRGLFRVGAGSPRGLEFSTDGREFCGGQGEADRVFADAGGGFWIRSNCGGGATHVWQRYDPATERLETLGERVGEARLDVTAVAEDRAGRLWLGRPGELRRWADGQWTTYDARAAWGMSEVDAIQEDARGRIWIATRGGTQLHDFDAGRFTSHPGRTSGGALEDVRCLLADREGNVWAGTGDFGLVRMQSRPLAPVASGAFSTKDEVFSVAPGKEGRVWLATSSGLVLHRGDAFLVFTNTMARLNDGWSRRARMVLEDRAGTVWAGLDRGLAVLQEGRLVDVELPRIRSREGALVTSLFEDRAGTLWVGTASGLLERHPQGFRWWTAEQGLAPGRVSGLAQGSDGALWIGTQGGGVSRFREGRFRTFGVADGLSSGRAWPLRVDADGTAWIGTPAGLNRIRGSEVRAVTRKQGLHENLAYAWLEDGKGNVWTHGNAGISRVRKAELEAVADGRAGFLACVNYGESDGMPSAEGNGDQQPNASRGADGRMWFPMTRGVVVADPTQVRDNDLRPRVVIEEVRMDQKTVFKDGGWAGGDAVGDGEDPGTGLRLGPGRGRVLEVRYTANTFVDSEKVRFRYRLAGHDEDWRDADVQRVAFYTDLRPGEYRFQVQARNHHGYWSEAPAEFGLSLAPHFHQRPVFPVVCGVFAALLLGTGHVLGVRAKRRRVRRRHRLELEAERSRIAKDLHDDLGSSLTGLALRLDGVRGAQQDPATAFRQLDELAQSLRGMVDRMREVVWTVNPRCDTLESFSAYVCAYAQNLLAAAGLRCRLDVPPDLPARTLSAEARHHLLMVAKEALNNAVRHAAASEVRVALGVERGELVMTLADNGRGFVSSSEGGSEPGASPPPGSVGEGTGNGLPNLRWRVARIGGRLEIHAVVGLGTRIIVRLPEDRHE